MPKGVWYSIEVKPTREDPRRDPSVLHSEHRVTQVSPRPRYTVEVDLLSTGAVRIDWSKPLDSSLGLCHHIYELGKKPFIH